VLWWLVTTIDGGYQSRSLRSLLSAEGVLRRHAAVPPYTKPVHVGEVVTRSIFIASRVDDSPREVVTIDCRAAKVSAEQSPSSDEAGSLWPRIES